MPHEIRLTLNGRAGLALIAQALEFRVGETVLLPAYHCPSLVEPFLASGATVVFYNVDESLNPVEEHFASCLTETARAVVFVRYFGFEGAAQPCVERARHAGLEVIHDCAHAYYALKHIPSTDFAIASLAKFFALEEGGIVFAPKRVAPALPAIVPANKIERRDLTILVRSLERAKQAGGLRPLASIVSLADWVRKNFRKREEPSSVAAPKQTALSSFRYYAPSMREQSVSLFSRGLLNVVGSAKAAEKRRRNFTFLVSVVSKLCGCRALYTELGVNTVPYVFPLILENADEKFAALRNLGIPLYRWEELASSKCAVSADYRHRLVQLPCHQDLTSEHMEFIAEVLVATFNSSAEPVTSK